MDEKEFNSKMPRDYGGEVENEWNQYGQWLMLTYMPQINTRGYSKLYHALHNRPFVAKLSHDISRIEDGYDLRNEAPFMVCTMEFPVSILEVLIGLSRRADRDYYGEPGDPRPDIIFDNMIHNLGLDQMPNGHFNRAKFDEIIDIWLERRFKYNGSGSIFPLKKPVYDQRKAEIWSQMNGYIGENYQNLIVI